MSRDFIIGFVIGSLLVASISLFYIGRYSATNEAMHWRIVAIEYQKSSDELIKQVQTLRTTDDCSVLSAIPTVKIKEKKG